MTQEEKAKAYDEAIEKLRDFYRDYDTVSCLIDVKEELANLFPELKESKDEKTRKRIIALVNAHGQGMYKDDMLAWLENIPYTIDHEKREGFHLGYKAALEKQGESYTKRDVDDAFVEGMAFAKNELEKQCKQNYLNYENINIQQKDFAPKPKETVKEAESNLTPLERKVKDILFSFHINAADGISFDGTMAIVHNLITLCQQEQKPAWSCEDETRLQACLDTLQANSLMGKVDTVMTKWLKSLKQRIKGE